MSNNLGNNFEPKPLVQIKMKNSWLESIFYVAMFGSAGIQILMGAGKVDYNPVVSYFMAAVLVLAALSNRVLVTLNDFLLRKVESLLRYEMTEVKCDDPTCSCKDTNAPMISETTDKQYPTNLS